MPVIAAATTPADYAAFADLCRAYVAWCRERYADLPWFVDAVFGHQALAAELDDVAASYGPPHGAARLARIDGTVVGGGAYRRVSATACELKRLFVAPAGRGHGIGRALAAALIADATAAGYTTILLDTADRMTEATALYASLGFERVEAYRDYPAELAARLTFMARPRSLAPHDRGVTGYGNRK